MPFKGTVVNIDNLTTQVSRILGIQSVDNTKNETTEGKNPDILPHLWSTWV